jgi:uncharacterized protein YciI
MSDLSVDELRKKMLGKKLWVVMTRRVVPLEEVAKHTKAHLLYQIKLEKDGIMYGAGPAVAPGATEASFGLIVIRAKDEADARRIADADPMHKEGVRKYELYQWTMNEGRLNITLNFSDQTYKLD